MTSEKQPGNTHRVLPYPVEVEANRVYWWCACGKSITPPFCDGHHQGTGQVPIRFLSRRKRIIFFCGCKHSSNAPLCDGSHSCRKQ